MANGYKPGNRVFMKSFNKVMLAVFARAVKGAYRIDGTVREILDAFDDDFIFRVRVMPNGGSFLLQKKKGKLVSIRKKLRKETQLDLAFKNDTSAFSALSGRTGIIETYCQKNIVVTGSVEDCMRLVEVMQIAECYLLGKRKMKKLSDAVPEKSNNSARMYIYVLLGI